jgi:hypothetical protein
MANVSLNSEKERAGLRVVSHTDTELLSAELDHVVGLGAGGPATFTARFRVGEPITVDLLWDKDLKVTAVINGKEKAVVTLNVPFSQLEFSVSGATATFSDSLLDCALTSWSVHAIGEVAGSSPAMVDLGGGVGWMPRLALGKHLKHSPQVILISPAPNATMGNYKIEFAVSGAPQAARTERVILDFPASASSKLFFNFGAADDARHKYQAATVPLAM